MSAANNHAAAEASAATNDQAAGRGPPPGAAGPGETRETRGMAWLPWAAGYLAAAIVLFLCYLRISETVTVTSDGAGIALQAWDMLHGNVLLHGWGLADVTFYTTEIPEYALVEIFRGLGPADVHICAAITYTLLVVLAGLLAKGNKTGKEGLVRVLIASGVMIAPQIGPGAFVLLLSPDHTGTSVPLLLIFLLLDRAPRRWWVPAAVGLMLAWTQIGDSLVAAIGAAPIVVVCGVRAYRGIVQGGEPVSVHWFDLALAVSAVVSVAVADAAVKIIGSLGGYTMATLDTVVARSASWAAHVSLTVDGLLHLYGAGLISGSLRFATGIAAVHLVGVALAAWATGRVIRRFFACDDMIAQILAVAIAVNVTAYAFSRLPTVLYASHEIAPVLPFGAVLAGRMLAERLARAKLLPALTAAACVYLAALAYGASLTPTPLRDQALINWLGAHHLTTGLGSYAEGDNIGLASHGTILIAVPEFHPASVDHRRLFLEKTSDFDPRQHNANFVVSTTEDGPSFHVPPAFAIRAFGRPARTYHYGPWTIMTWNKNLLYEIR